MGSPTRTASYLRCLAIGQPHQCATAIAMAALSCGMFAVDVNTRGGLPPSAPSWSAPARTPLTDGRTHRGTRNERTSGRPSKPADRRKDAHTRKRTDTKKECASLGETNVGRPEPRRRRLANNMWFHQHQKDIQVYPNIFKFVTSIQHPILFAEIDNVQVLG